MSHSFYSKTLNIGLLLSNFCTYSAYCVHSNRLFFYTFFYGSLTEKKIPSHKIAIRYLSTRLYYVIIKNKLKYYQLIKATYLHTRFCSLSTKFLKLPGRRVQVWKTKLVLHKNAGNRLDQVTQVNFSLISHL